MTLVMVSAAWTQDSWVIDSQADWTGALGSQENLDIKNGVATPSSKGLTYRCAPRRFRISMMPPAAL
jgi:hypothetical protein